MRKVLITDDCHSFLTEQLEKAGWQCDFQPDITPEKTMEIVGDYQGLIVNSKIQVNRAFLEIASQLRFIGRLGSGMEIIDREYAVKKGIAVLSSPEGNRNAVAEQALGMLLALANNLVRSDREVRQNIWRREANRGFELAGKTIGLIGFGHTGQQFAKKLQGMEMQVLAHDKYKTRYTKEFSWVKESSPEEIQQQSHIISLHLPLSSETKHYINKNFLQRCQPGVIILNTSRGACIEIFSLTEALETGRAGGACLDVFENEKVATYTEEEKKIYGRLHQLENVILSPHIAGWTQESKKRIAEVLFEKIIGAVN
jgi:D-3-phosphoglycerate dehydrogenase